MTNIRLTGPVDRRPTLLCLLLLALCAVSDAAAAGAVEEIQVTASRGAGTVQDVSEGLTLVGQEQIDAAQIQVVTDALRGQTGVYVQQTTPGQGTVIVRGLKGSEVLHLVDGMRLNNALFRNAPNQYLALVDPFIAQRVEVVRGPLSTLYGSDAMGGVVQIVTARPFLGGGPWQRESRFAVRYDSRTLGHVGHASIAAGGGAFSFGGALSYQDHDDLRAADRVAQSPSAYRSEAASGFFTYAPSERRQFDLSVQYLEQPDTPRYDELVAGFGQTAPASDVFRFEPNSRLFVHARHRSSGWGRWLEQFEVNLALQRMTDDRRTRDAGAVLERREDNLSESIGLTLRGAAEPGAVHALTYGIDVYLDEVASTRREVDIRDGTTALITPRFPDGSTLDSADIYVQDALRLGPRLGLTLGGRLSRARVELTGSEVRPAGSITNTNVTASVGLRYEVSESWSLLGNIGRGFRAPNIFDLGTLGARPGNRFNIANPDLAPETVVTMDVGVRVGTDALEGELFFWASDYRDKITSVSTGQTDDAGRDIVQSRNAEAVTLRGAELALRYALSERLQADVGLNAIWGETEIPGAAVEPADRIPPLNGRLGLRYERQNWWLAGELRYADAQDRLSSRDITDPRIDPDGTAGWGVLNLRGGLRLTDAFALTVGIDNLTDRGYREHGSGIDAAGRSAILTLEGRF